MMVARMAYWAALFGGMRRDEREEGGSPFGFLAMIIVAPIAATLIQLAISRALEKIARVSSRIPLAGAGPATAHLWIVNPLKGDRLANLFSTHPPIEERIR